MLNILYDIPYIFGYKSVNPASHVPINNLTAFFVKALKHTVFYVAKTIDFFRSEAIYDVQCKDVKSKLLFARALI